MKMLSTYSSHIKFENDLLQYRVRGKIKNRISTFSFDRHNKIFILQTLDLLGGDTRVKLKKEHFVTYLAMAKGTLKFSQNDEKSMTNKEGIYFYIKISH
jgi:hypothetical protein